MSVSINSYDAIFLPSELSVLLVSFLFCLALAPFFGGQEVGSLKIPKLTNRSRAARVLLPAVFLISLMGYVPLWSVDFFTYFGLIENPEMALSDSDAEPVGPVEQGRRAPTGIEGRYTFSGRIGNYDADAFFDLTEDCNFVGKVSFSPTPTGGVSNKIRGSITGLEIYFVRTMSEGQQDRFSGKLTNDGQEIAGEWGAFPFKAKLGSPILSCVR